MEQTHGNKEEKEIESEYCTNTAFFVQDRNRTDNRL